MSQGGERLSQKGEEAFRTISEVADEVDLPPHVLRFWETRFAQIKPLKRGGGRRYYRPADVELIAVIRQLLYGDGYTIKGVQRILKTHGVRAVLQARREGTLPSPAVVEGTLAAADPSGAPSGEDRAGASGPVPPDADAWTVLDDTLAIIDECRRILAGARES